MANEINLKIKVGDDGTLKIVGKEADKAAKSTDNLGKSTDKLNRTRDKTHRQEKSLHQSGLSGAKAFSKQAQTINGGSSSLVGAYAVLAANIFALTAAFGALQRAAQVEQLEGGLRAMGTASGIAMKQLSEGLREATGNALNLADAMRATALASSAGFDSSSIERLGKVARQASIALGRDTADSLNRLTKGAIKLEPELLDELGIMVRLDEATEAYARSVNKSAGDLTNFEKRQAFMNAVLEEGERKFAAMADVPTNAYDQLSATFQDLTKTLLNLLNKGLLPVINFFAGSQMALFGAMVMFGKTIAASMIPGLANLGAKYREAAAATAAHSLEQLKSLKNIEGGGANLKKLAKAYDPAIHGQEGLNKMMKTAERSYKINATGLEKLGKRTKENAEAFDIKKAKMEASSAAIQTLTQYQEDFNKTTLEDTKANAAAAAASGDYRGAIAGLGESFARMNQQSKESSEGLGKWSKRGKSVGLVAAKAALSVKVLGLAFLNAIPFIGQMIAIFGVLVSVFSKVIDFFKDPAQKEYEEQLKKQTEANKELAASLKEVDKFNRGVNSTIGSVTQKYVALTNVFRSYNKQLEDLNKTGKTGAEMFFGGRQEQKGPYKDMLRDVFQANQMSRETFDELTKGMEPAEKAIFELAYAEDVWGQVLDRDAKTMLNAFIPGVFKSAEAINNMTQSVKEGNTAIDEFANAISFKTSVDNVLASFSNMSKGMKDFGGSSAKEWVKGFQEQSGENLKSLINLDDLTKQSTSMHFPVGNVTDYEKLRSLIKAATDEYTNQFKAQQEVERVNKAQQANLKAQIGILKHRNLENGNARKIVDKENELREKQKTLLESQIKNFMSLNNLTDDDRDTNEHILSLQAQINELTEKRATEEDKLVADAKEQLGLLEHQQTAMKETLAVMGQMNSMQNKLLDAKQKSLEADIEAQNRADPSRGYKGALNAADKLKALDSDIGKVLEIDEKGVLKQSEETKTMLEAREIAIENELNMTKLKNDMERRLLQFRLRVIDAELQAAHKRSGGEGDYSGRETLTGMMDQLVDGGSFDVMQDNLAEAIAEAARKGLTNEVGRLKEQQASEIIGAEGSTSAEIIANQNEAGGIAALDKTSQKFQAMQTAIGPMVESLKQLGPEGELVASVAQGALAIGESWATASEKIKNASGSMEKGAAIATAIGQTMSQIGNIMNAASNARIAGIDKEIAAEKKRDGKSKESLAKIKQLEKKKEQEKRKAFERNKKMQMAQTIINTAAAIMEASPNIPMMILMGIMGAAQLAVISGTSYQGGGSSEAGAAVPSSVALGKRTEKSDLSKSQSARGELAYFRGDQGIGGPENFRPAFGGRKHYATGGNMGYVVGEQGPELFMPERPGTIVPADDTAAVMGGTTNVTFSINAIDASGVEEVLAQQQGNIIGMIRTAANSYGEEFMEDLDETTYTAPVARRA